MGQVRSCLEDNFRPLVVKGEVRDARQPRSGHLYFNLCDTGGRLRIVVFASTLRRIRHSIRDGGELVVWGRISAYARSGDVQLIADGFEPAGLGVKWEQREQLRKGLQAEGLFAPERKQELPWVPGSVGVVTSPSGSAIHDVMTTLKRRFPALRIVVAPVQVNGAAAAPAIADTIARLDALGNVDVILVVRGGGSAEDLACFDDEAVVRAIAGAKTPVISGVGHEDDVTLVDLVADRRAPTPTGAAELAVPERAELFAAIERHAQRLSVLTLARIEDGRRRVDAAARSHALRVPGLRVESLNLRLDEAQRRLELLSPQALVGRWRTQLQDAERRLSLAAQNGVNRANRELVSVVARLESLSPLKVLSRGYSLTTTEDGTLVQRPADAPPGSIVLTRLADGAIRARVLKPDPVDTIPAETQ
jgi:exodeoxyribonuclease VII large subunit